MNTTHTLLSSLPGTELVFAVVMTGSWGPQYHPVAPEAPPTQALGHQFSMSNLYSCFSADFLFSIQSCLYYDHLLDAADFGTIFLT